MKKILQEVAGYFSTTDKRVLLASALFTAVFVFINFHFGLNGYINSREEPLQYLYWFLVFLAAFSFPYSLSWISGSRNYFRSRRFILLLLLAPALFAWKMSFDLHLPLSLHQSENLYWNNVIYWPFKLVLMMTVLLLVWKLTGGGESFYGLTWKGFRPGPYLLMLGIMVPLVAAASTQPDFLAMYPKLKNVSYLSGDTNTFFHKLLYELSYGSDFIGIELFFRGFLVLAFVQIAGKDAILPMAVFYCTIHFGKPLGECISSFFGGLVLGIVTYHTRNILGGLVVHLGIAWMMELGGYIGNNAL